MIRSVRDACVLHPDAKDIRVSDSIQQIDAETTSADQGREFLQQSFITNGMRELVKQTLRRLDGKTGTAPVFKLKQAMGGGKTHLMKAMAFLAKHPALRSEFFSEIAAGITFKDARVVFFNGRTEPDDYFWGRLADQLGKPGHFETGARAPGEDRWLSLFDTLGGTPALILLDELPPYFDYLRTQISGSGTVAEIASRAFSNLLTAVVKRPNVCVIVSDLEASHQGGTALINQALNNAQRELGRVEVTITPVDLAGGETYAILKKRLFLKLPDDGAIADLADEYARALKEGQQGRTIDNKRSPEQFAAEIQETYPFHPQMKHLFALFKENKEFQQTRGLMELTSRLIRSVWDRPDSDVFLIGPQHFDLGIEDVRRKIEDISRMDTVIAKDIWSTDRSAGAQLIDDRAGNDAARQAGTLLLISSLSTALNTVRGLTESETLECLLTPHLTDLAPFRTAIHEIVRGSWYLHKTAEGRIYFDRQQNLTKMLADLAAKATENQVDKLLKDRLSRIYEPKLKSVYQHVIPLATLSEVKDEVRRVRTLVIVPPDSRVPPEEVVRFFESLVEKNNLLVLTGEKSTEMNALRGAASQLVACAQAEAQKMIESVGPKRDEFEEKKNGSELNLLSAIRTLFDKLLFPILRNGKDTLQPRNLEQSGDQEKGEQRIIVTLRGEPAKLIDNLSDEPTQNMLRARVESLFQGSDELPWREIIERAACSCSMPWLPPGEMDRVKARAFTEGKWEDLKDGRVSKKPKPKTTSVQVVESTDPDDSGTVVLDITPVNATVSDIHYAEDSDVSATSQLLSSKTLATSALRVSFLCIDRQGLAVTGLPTVWKNKLTLRHLVSPAKGRDRQVTIFVAPTPMVVKYTLDGSEPRNGIDYKGPFVVPDQGCTLQIFASADEIENKVLFRVESGIQADAREVPRALPVTFGINQLTTLSSRDATFRGLDSAAEMGVFFGDVTVTLTGDKPSARLNLKDLNLSAADLLQMIKAISTPFADGVTLTFQFRNARFQKGQDLMDFCKATGVPLTDDWEEG